MDRRRPSRSRTRCTASGAVGRRLPTVLSLLLGALFLRPDFSQADWFGSSGSGYGSGNTTRRTGKQAVQDDSVYCQQTPEGQVIPKPYGGTRRNIPCGLPGTRAPEPPPVPPEPPCSCAPETDASNLRPGRYGASSWRGETGGQTCRCEEPWVPVFNYYYINGINTPRDGSGRGNYRWDYAMVRANLLDLATKPVGFQQRPRQPADLKVAPNEQNVFDVETYNFSGTEPLHKRGGLCDGVQNGTMKLGVGLRQAAEVICLLDDRWRASAAGGMSPGDVLESFFQSQISLANFAATEYDVMKWAEMIRRKYEGEQRSREKNFFILIAHSQGNFFAEGVAYRLNAGWEGESGKAVFRNRLGILSLASPTSYRSLQDGRFMQSRIQHFTRHDDGIQALRMLQGLGAKIPWDDNLPSLWPWGEGMLEQRKQLIELSRCWPPTLACSPFFETMSLEPGNLCTPDTNPVCNHALYIPLMNSHLLDNYLTDPPLTMPGKPINRKILDYIALLKPLSPSAPPVLTEIRGGLKDLKGQLLNAGRSER